MFVSGDEITGIIDWSEAAPGDAMFDLAILTLGHEERLDDVLTVYGPGADRAVFRAWWSLRSLTAIRWLTSVTRMMCHRRKATSNMRMSDLTCPT